MSAAYLGPPVYVPQKQSASAKGQAAPSLSLLEAVTTLANVRVNDTVDDAPNQSQSGTTLALDPTDPRRLVSGFNDCRGFTIPSRNGLDGWGYSTDGGKSWTSPATNLPKAAAADFGSMGSPSIDVDSEGNFFYASLYQPGTSGPLAVSVYKGRFDAGGGFAWNLPTFANRLTSGDGLDKPHVGVDKRADTHIVYVSYTNFSAGENGQVEVVRSTDGGVTWSAPVVIAEAAGTVHQGSIPRVGPDGEVYVVWEDGFAQAIRSLHVRKATAWPSFGPDVQISAVTSVANPTFNTRVNEFPTAAVDNTNGPNRGHLYVAWNDGRFGGNSFISSILLSHSADGGDWSDPVALNDDGDAGVSGTAHWNPWIAVDGLGNVLAGWYDRRLRTTSDSSLTDVFAATFKLDGGAGANRRLTSQSFSMNVPSACTPNFGDYNGGATGTSEFHFAYGDGRGGNPDVFSAGFQSSALQVDLGGGEVCRETTATGTVTVYGGAGLFDGPVTLTLDRVDPVPPAGGEIGVTFDPNPTPTPDAAGATSTLRITTTAATPAGSYTLYISGASDGFSATTPVTLLVRSGVPTAPVLTSPANGTDGVSGVPTFTWAAAPQASQYTLEILESADCTGTPVRSFVTSGTSFAVPAAQALTTFQTYSWRVTASNACSQAASQCFTFRTESCSPVQDFAVNGGFEDGLTGWTIDGSIPAPLLTSEQVHGGTSAVRLGNTSGTVEPLGDSALSQTYTFPATSAPTLVFWEFPVSTDTVTFDQQYVRVTPINPAGPTVELLREARNDQAWVRRELSLAQFAGQTVKVTFGAHQDGFGDITGWYIDDVAVAFSNCGPPEFAVHVTPPPVTEVCAGASIDYTVSVDSINGPNFTSPVNLTALNLPPGATATFAQNPVAPGTSTTLTVTTARPTVGQAYSFTVAGEAVTPPPTGARTATATVLVDANAPNAPERISPRDGDVNLPRRPTLSWTVPFVPDLVAQKASKAIGRFTWQLAAATAPGNPMAVIAPHFFGAQKYHVQVARDAGLSDIVVEADTTAASYTLTVDLDVAATYFWRVNASNACGASDYSSSGRFTIGACFESWQAAAPYPNPAGNVQGTVIASESTGRLYAIGGGLGGGPDERTNQVWAYDVLAGTWTRKADVPAPGIGANFGAGVELDGQIYVFGGVNGPPGPIAAHRFAWRYSIAGDTWTRLADEPTDNFGSAVAAIGGKIYLAYGSTFLQQTWLYDPATNTYTRKADAPAQTATLRLHAVVLGGEMHAFAGGFEGSAHAIYNPATNTWRQGPKMPFTATDPAVGVLGGKAYVVGGRPVARTQIYDPATNGWTQGATITGAPNGVDNTAGTAIGLSFHVIGGFDGVTSTALHWQFHACSVGDLSSASFLPFVIDDDGTVFGNQKTSLLLNNAISGTTLNTTCILYRNDGAVDATQTITVAPNELKTVTDVVRKLRGAEGVQNFTGSLALFGTDVFHGGASIIHNDSNDSAFEEGQPFTGIKNGFIPNVRYTSTHFSQASFSNLSSTSAFVQLFAYAPAGGDTPQAASLVVVPAHGTVSYSDIVTQLGLPYGEIAQLSFTSTQPLSVVAREQYLLGAYSGFAPVRDVASAASTVYVPYVEDSAAFSTALELNNPGPTTANVTVKFVDGVTGATASRDLPVAVNAAVVLADVVRWATRSDAGTVTGKRGHVVVTTPQAVTAQARLVNVATQDPAVPEQAAPLVSAFATSLVRIEPFVLAKGETKAPTLAAAPVGVSRVALANVGTTTATVELVAVNASGSPVGTKPVVVSVPAGRQFVSENLGETMDLPPVFFGWATIRSNAPLLVYHHRLIGGSGTVLPVHSK